MSDKPYTDADVELLARVEYGHDQTRSSIDRAYRMPWDAGRLVVGRVYRDRARAALDALVADGWQRSEPPRPVRCPATVGVGHTARQMHPDGQCPSVRAEG